MKRRAGHIFFFLFLLFAEWAIAQRPVISPRNLPTGNYPAGRREGIRNANDTASGDQREGVERRDYSDDSLRVKVYTFNTVRPSAFDTSIIDYTRYFPIPATFLYLGNDGSATRSLLFTTPARTGWDPGFHALDVYKFSLANVRFYSTPKPYTELGYMLATGSEQLIDVLHTQNVKPNWNVSFQYRLLTAPGIFRNQRNNHSNIQLASWYQSPNKRYNNYFVFLNNNLSAGESGGLVTEDDLKNPTYDRRFTIPTVLGGSPTIQGSAFNNSFNTGHTEKERFFYLRQQYDFGRKDSIVTDSTVIPLFYPRVRFEHSLRVGRYDYSYKDLPNSSTGNRPDSAYYHDLYNIKLTPSDTANPLDSVFLQDKWREISNDFSIYQYPDANNLQQFIRVGAELQLLNGTFKTGSKSYTNIIGHGEYRNRTRNQKWDINAFGRLHLAGANIGDYHAFISLQRLLSKDIGTLQVGFENINRSPSFLYNQRSSFYLDQPKDFSKENTLHFFGSYYLPKLAIQLRGDYYIVSNYLYLNGYNKLQQERALFNVLRISGSKTFRIGRHWRWYSDVYVQQKAGGAEVNFPLLFTRNRLALEGRFFRNLELSTGLEMRYNTPYKADSYSPVLGQFFYQDTTTINNRPELHAFLHMKVRNFKAFIRLENLNTADFTDGFGFKRNNLAAIRYPTPGMVFRFGIYWAFVN